MARRLRYCPQGLAQHIVHRGHNRQDLFRCPADFLIYQSEVAHRARSECLEIHAWVFMTNHVHLLVTPMTDHSISRFIQKTASNYSRYFNRAYKHSGAVWEGRFHNSPITSERYLLQAQMYIEMNPVRAHMCKHPADYRWSSYRCSVGVEQMEFFTPSILYRELGSSDSERITQYKDLMGQYLQKGSE